MRCPVIQRERLPEEPGDRSADVLCLAGAAKRGHAGDRCCSAPADTAADQRQGQRKDKRTSFTGLF
jgi:hypothetical protein